MGNEAAEINTNPQTPASTPYEQAVAMLEEQFRAGSPEADANADAEGDQTATAQPAPSSSTAEPPPAEKTPEQLRAELEEQKRELSKNAATIQGQHAALTRRRADFEREKADIDALRAELSGLKSFPQIVAFVAKQRGNVEPEELWRELVDDLKAGGKRSTEVELRDELRQLKTDRQSKEAAERQRQEREEQERAAQEDREALSAFGAKAGEAAKAKPELYPSLAKYPANMVGASAILIQMQTYERTGGVLTLDQVMAQLEQDAKSQLGEATTAPPQPAPQKKPNESPKKAPRVTTPTNADASAVDPRTLSLDERKELAARQLQAQLNTG